MAKRHDWEAVERDYRTGRFSLQQLSDRHGPSKSQISKKAAAEGWEKDLTGAVQQRTREKLSRPEASAPDVPESDIIEQASDENAAIVRGHRAALSRWRRIADRFADRLDQQLEAGEITVQLKSGELASIDLPLDYIAKAMGAGTQAFDRVIRLERQSYGLDQDDANDQEKTFEELMAEVAPDEPE
ncbi:hypothetical protein [Halomonas elongata]|uniref:Terminase small subunit n=1 Tax=Halomonas elongata (strain ATCC 33173 / DSM 2581 / NBRC 15536 / NCIMB 2198 / 1H9) TaxID=768066 RepID=E1V352_HALED|nr:hypothetical protein [Halomonas elongata]WBF19815.1 hypothetical protein LM502_09050 [Halomonas elongata]WPU48684.1 hypothetical protein SR933_07275 [Halomonas elongata DSM 2581]CBV42531.1 uncharacterized protein HELO_2647 [Halomonas elongata DSM 2581]